MRHGWVAGQATLVPHAWFCLSSSVAEVFLAWTCFDFEQISEQPYIIRSLWLELALVWWEPLQEM